MSKKRVAKAKQARDIENLPAKTLTAKEARTVKGGFLMNLANMRHELLKSIAQNLRS